MSDLIRRWLRQDLGVASNVESYEKVRKKMGVFCINSSLAAVCILPVSLARSWSFPSSFSAKITFRHRQSRLFL